MQRGRRRVVAAWCLSLLVGLAWFDAPALVAPAVATEADHPVRILLLGDSITQGSSGDWTWRYRLWQHLASTATTPFDFVGPDDGLHASSLAGAAAYGDPAFDREHAARWGNSLALPSSGLAPGTLARVYTPDVAVVLLGINDLMWLGEQPAEVAGRMADTIAALRENDPGVDVVLSLLPHRQLAGVPETNELYEALAAALDTPEERVVIAHADRDFQVSTPQQVEDTYDVAHPTTRGELKIAAAVADALASLGVGTAYPRPLPRLALGPAVVAALAGRAGDRTVQLTWATPEGPTGNVLWARDATAGASWAAASEVLTEPKRVVVGLTNGHRYQFALQPVKGWSYSDLRSNVVTLTPRAPAPARPSRPSLRALAGGVRVSWAAVPHATRYVVGFRRAGASTWRTRVTPDRSMRISGLKPGSVFVFRVQAERSGSRGPWSASARAAARPAARTA